jgi:outer membrane protein assembly factor BamB
MTHRLPCLTGSETPTLAMPLGCGFAPRNGHATFCGMIRFLKPTTWNLALAGITTLLAGFVGFPHSAIAAPPVIQTRSIASQHPGWPQFRGPRRDGISDERGLLQTWPEPGPEPLWSAKGIGRGYSSPILAGDRIYITGDVEGELHLFAMTLTGHPLWRATNGLAWFRPYPGARSSVTYSAGRLYHQNARGRLASYDASSGRELWAIQTLERFGGANITWGLSECLLVDDRAVYVTAGGREALVVALDKLTGTVLWQSESLVDAEGDHSVESPSYVSPILIQFGERRLIVGCSIRHLFCVDADTGAIQWTRRRPTTHSVIAMMPALVEDGIFIAAPHGDPGRLYRLLAPQQSGAPVSVLHVWDSPLDTGQGGVVHVGGRIYGSYYPGRKGWAAIDATTGTVLYETSDLLKGAILYADQRLYALSEDGWMWLLEPTDDQFEIRGRFQFVDARERDAWAHPVVYDGKLYLRYHDTLSAYQIRAGQ